MHSRVLAAALLCPLMAAAAPASAADSQPLGGLLLRFFSTDNPVILRDAPAPFSHAAHFVSQPVAQSVLQELNKNIATQISTFPLGSSSPGFTFTFDPTTGVFNRSADSFGPVFSERPLTAGKRKLSFGVSYLRASYDTLEGQKLRENDLQLYLTHQDVNSDAVNTNPWFEGDVIRADLSIDIKTNTTVAVANYGVTDRLDIGIAVPFQSVKLDTRITTTLDRLSTDADAPALVLHIFPDGTNSHVFGENGEASGLGDVVLRGKYNFMRRPNMGLAMGLDLRVPTGDEDNLLGSGATQTRLYLIAGASGKRFAPRANAGYTFSSGGGEFTGELPNELSYSAGFDAVLHSRATFTADILGRTLIDTGRVVERDRSFSFVLRNTPTNVQTVTRQSAVSESGKNLNLLLGAANVKINIVGRLLVNAGALFGLGDSGLQDTVTPVFGIDYAF